VADALPENGYAVVDVQGPVKIWTFQP
jgi:hypothetical protein